MSDTIPTYVLKTVFKNTIRRFTLESPSFQNLESHARKAYPDQIGNPHVVLTFKYEDDEGDVCIISNDAELAEAFAVKSSAVLKVFVEASTSTHTATSETKKHVQEEAQIPAKSKKITRKEEKRVSKQEKIALKEVAKQEKATLKDISKQEKAARKESAKLEKATRKESAKLANASTKNCHNEGPSREAKTESKASGDLPSPQEMADAVVSFLSDTKIQDTLPQFLTTLLQELKSGLEQGGQIAARELDFVVTKALTQYQVIGDSDAAKHALNMLSFLPSPELVYTMLLQVLTQLKPLFQQIPILLRQFDLPSKGQWLKAKLIFLGTRIHQHIQKEHERASQWHAKHAEKQAHKASKQAEKLASKLSQHQVWQGIDLPEGVGQPFDILFPALHGALGPLMALATGVCAPFSPSASTADANPSAASNEPVVHPRHTCDGCQTHPIVGVRFHCSVCPDYDLCESCESKNLHPPEHPLVKIKVGENVPPSDVHVNIQCDGCGCHPIKGVRYQCSVCPDFDLCSDCEANGKHPQDHPLVKHKVRNAFRRHGYWGRRGRGRGRWGGCHGRRFGGRRDGLHCPPAPASRATADAVSAPTCATATAASATANTSLSTAESSTYFAKFVKDNNYPDQSSVPTGHTIIKEWVLRNAGTTAWPTGTKVIFLRGDRLLIDEVEEFPVGSVAPGAEVTVSVPLLMPFVSETSKNVSAFFRLADGDRNQFGERFWVSLKVVSQVTDRESSSSDEEVAAETKEDGHVEDVSEHDEDFEYVPHPDQPNPWATAAASAASVPASVPSSEGTDPESARATESVKPTETDAESKHKGEAGATAATESGAVEDDDEDDDNEEEIAALQEQYGPQMATLSRMGFTNTLLNGYLLSKHNGNVEQTVTWLLKLDVSA